MIYKFISMVLFFGVTFYSCAHSPDTGSSLPAVQKTASSEASSVSTTPTGMEVKTTGDGKVQTIQKACPPKAERSPTAKKSNQVSIGIQKKLDKDQSPTAFSKYEECE